MELDERSGRRAGVRLQIARRPVIRLILGQHWEFGRSQKFLAEKVGPFDIVLEKGIIAYIRPKPGPIISVR